MSHPCRCPRPARSFRAGFPVRRYPIAESLSFEEAATLPCAGVTAWNALIGVLSLQGESDPKALMVNNASLRGIFVGSAEMATHLNAFVDRHHVKPEIGREFDFEEARAAYDYQASAELFGKVVIADPA